MPRIRKIAIPVPTPQAVESLYFAVLSQSELAAAETTQASISTPQITRAQVAFLHFGNLKSLTLYAR